MSDMQVSVLASHRDDVHPPRGFCAVAVSHPGAPGSQEGIIVRPTGVGSEATLPAAIAKALSLITERPATMTATMHVDREAYDALTRAGTVPATCTDALEAWRDVASMTAALGDRLSVIGDLGTAERGALASATATSMSREGVPLRGPRGHY